MIVASAAALGEGRFRPVVLLAALVAALLIQIGANLANDLFDFKRGADTTERTGPVRVTQAGLLSEREVAAGTAVTLGLAFLVGLYLVWAGGWPILAVGMASIAGAILYTGGPWPLGYHGLGDLFVFIFFGLVAVVTTYYLHTGEAGAVAFTLALPVAFIVTDILVVNNLRDIATDRAAGKRTVAVRIGARATRIQYVLFLAGAYAVPLALGLTGRMGSLFWLPLLSLPLAYRLSRTVLGGSEGPDLNRVLKGTGQLHLLFAILLGLALVWRP
ncbi:1,4-dihydroxy-2-naphthoate prenyltransferase [Limnochorda pilosa]|uniref:1,4-dihydroxy-2-naphthoate octaprenyltransferase n=1 Tax=Limnochorda pilosa TaxID=1555112 RepID=A0A0K2SMB4_LIMPI|nr:1,4-dihydroxy-2-naphthoate prenyltransferase [Limnochorda pilosa]